MPRPTTLRVTLDGERTYDVELRQVDGRTVARVDGRDLVVELREGTLGGLVDGRPVELAAGDGAVFLPGCRPLRLEVAGTAPVPRVEPHPPGPCEVKSPITGIVVAVLARPGSLVAQGEPLLLVEAMKMENRIRAPRAGRVAHVAVAQGDLVRAGQPVAGLA